MPHVKTRPTPRQVLKRTLPTKEDRESYLKAIAEMMAGKGLGIKRMIQMGFPGTKQSIRELLKK